MNAKVFVQHTQSLGLHLSTHKLSVEVHAYNLTAWE